MIAILALAAAAVAEPAGPPLRITESRFYAEHVEPDGTVIREDTRRVPYVPDASCYGWAIRFTPVKGVRILHERLVLPAPAERWGGVDGDPDTATRLSRDRAVGVTDLVAVLPTGAATHGWCVAAGDPRGDYRIEVIDGERRIAQFDFAVGDAPAPRP